jgi:hypothetical protein
MVARAAVRVRPGTVMGRLQPVALHMVMRRPGMRPRMMFNAPVRATMVRRMSRPVTAPNGVHPWW